MDYVLTFCLILCFGLSHGKYSYFEKEVVKLVDFVDTVDWNNLKDDLTLDGGAKVNLIEIKIILVIT
jgi:hypothetical protein